MTYLKTVALGRTFILLKGGLTNEIHQKNNNLFDAIIIYDGL